MSIDHNRLDLSAGVVLILPGIALALLSSRFDGFAKGMCQGAAVALLLLGVYLISARWRRHTSGSADDGDDMWLPSRDEGRDDTR